MIFKQLTAVSLLAPPSPHLQRILFITVLSLYGLSSHAQNFNVGASLGTAMVDSSDYENGGVYDFSIGYHYNTLQFSLGHITIKDIELDDVSDSWIDIDGNYIALSKIFDFDKYALELGAGYMFTDTEAYYLDRLVTTNDDNNPFINGKAILNLNDSVALLVDWKYLNDVTGRDINLAQFGITFSF